MDVFWLKWKGTPNFKEQKAKRDFPQINGFTEEKFMSTSSSPAPEPSVKPPESDVSRYKVRLVVEDYGAAEGELIRFQSPITVDNLAKALPFEGRAARWKEEIYFETPVKLGVEKPKSNVDVGTIAYWPMGSALCIFYGTTQPYSPVNLVGKITSNLELFAK